MANEIWKPMPGEPWSKLYEISNLGRVRTVPQIVVPSVNQGYLQVALRYKGHEVTVRVHRMVAEAFIRPPISGEIVNHINAIRSDNRPENLEWTDHKGNIEHTIAMGRHPFGQDHWLGKIDWDVAVAMRKSGATFTAIGKRFGATKEAASQMFKRAIKRGRYTE